MYKNLIAIGIATCLLFFSCKKSGNPGGSNPASSPITITLVSGSGQTAIAGYGLNAPVTVKVSQNGQPLNNYQVTFVGSGCNADFPKTVNTLSDGTLPYSWTLSGDVGTQTLKAYAVSASGSKIDSVTATATATAPGTGFQLAGCSIGNNSMAALVKLSTGRLFALHNGQDYLRYSDDNGVNWYVVKSFGNAQNCLSMVASSSDELFVFTMAGTFYSADAGQTWSQISTFAFSNDRTPTGAICTQSGKLIFCQQSVIQISLDKGKTWTSKTMSDEDIESPSEDNSGNLYVVGRGFHTIYKSPDNGVTWNSISVSLGAWSMFIDPSTNWMYITSDVTGIYISKDEGNTYNMFAPTGFVAAVFSIQSDGNYYFEDSFYQNLYQSKGVTSTFSLLYQMENTTPAPYVVAKNGAVIIGDNSYGSIYYQNK